MTNRSWSSAPIIDSWRYNINWPFTFLMRSSVLQAMRGGCAVGSRCVVDSGAFRFPEPSMLSKDRNLLMID